MNANVMANERRTNDTASSDERRGGAQRTVAPTRVRIRAATSRDGRRTPDRAGRTTAAPRRGNGHDGEPMWEDDSGTMPPEEWS